MPPEPPRRGTPIGRITELVTATAPHTPVPPPNDKAPTARPPAPDRREPPKEYARPRPMVRAPSVTPQPPPLPSAETDEHTLVGPPVALWPPPDALPSLVPPATVERYERALEQKARKLPGEPTIKGLLFKLLAALIALAAALTVTAQFVNVLLEPIVKKLEAKQDAQAVVIGPLPAAAASADKSADACRDWARAYDDYNRQVLAKAGIIVPERDNAPPVTPIELDQTPLPRSGKLTAAPMVRIKTKPPQLP